MQNCIISEGDGMMVLNVGLVSAPHGVLAGMEDGMSCFWTLFPRIVSCFFSSDCRAVDQDGFLGLILRKTLVHQALR
jgi:hypothetical protein